LSKTIRYDPAVKKPKSYLGTTYRYEIEKMSKNPLWHSRTCKYDAPIGTDSKSPIWGAYRTYSYPIGGVLRYGCGR